MSRREVTFYNEPQPEDGETSSGIQLILTRRGVEVSAWYDNICGMPSLHLAWEQIDEARGGLGPPRRQSFLPVKR